MKTALVLLISLFVLAGCATTQPPADGSMTVTVPAEKVAQCRAQGGCGIFSAPQIMEMVQQGYDLGEKSCRGGV